MASDDAKTFAIEGKEYEVPILETFDLDEAQILWDYTGYGLEDFAPPEDGQASEEWIEQIAHMIKNPGYRRTLVHVAYRRGNPRVKPEQIKVVAGKVSNLDSIITLLNLLDEEDDAGPPELTSTPSESSPSGSEDSSGSSGNGSSTVSEEPDELPTPIGITRLDTSPTSDPMTSVV